MARDSSLYVRRAAMAAMKADAGVTALVPAASIYPATVVSDPDYPIIVYGDTEAQPMRRSCVDGMTISLSFTAYAKPRYDADGRMIETAEDVAKKIAAALAAALDRKRLTLATEYEAYAHMKWAGGLSRRAGAETDTWQAIVRFTARVIS